MPLFGSWLDDPSSHSCCIHIPHTHTQAPPLPICVCSLHCRAPSISHALCLIACQVVAKHGRLRVLLTTTTLLLVLSLWFGLIWGTCCIQPVSCFGGPADKQRTRLSILGMCKRSAPVCVSVNNTIDAPRAHAMRCCREVCSTYSSKMTCTCFFHMHAHTHTWSQTGGFVFAGRLACMCVCVCAARVLLLVVCCCCWVSDASLPRMCTGQSAKGDRNVCRHLRVFVRAGAWGLFVLCMVAWGASVVGFSQSSVGLAGTGPH